ncbi:unnamed protein product [Heterobilharzia americana]|nr:unnamed protein product [Heterobilharzia americana]
MRFSELSLRVSDIVACALKQTSLRRMATKIGLVQMQSTSNKTKNFQQAVKLINEAKASGARMVFLPECFDFVGSSVEETLSLSEVKTWISLGGAHIKVNESDDRVYNAHIIINADGRIVAQYHKVHLFDADLNAESTTLLMTKSESTQSFFSELGLAICYDMRFPELAAHLRYAKNAQVLTYPSAYMTYTGEAGHWHTLIRARAIENQCYVVAAAQEGKHNEKRSSYGHSLVVDPWGQIIAEQINSGPGLLLCEIGPFKIEDSTESSIPKIYRVRKSMPVEYHRRFDLFPMSDSGCPRPIQSSDFTFGPHTIKPDCVFYQSELSFAFVNISPLVPGHILVCPIVCIPRFCQLTTAQIADLYMTVRRIAERLAEHHSATSLTISIQDGEDAGQSVPHVHVHVLPRKPNDFPENDNIYKALQKHDKVKNRVNRSHEVMRQEAEELRQLYYLNVLE